MEGAIRDMNEEMRSKIAAALASDDWTDGEKMMLKFQWGKLGGFYTSLIKTMLLADPENLCRFHGGFASLTIAVKNWKAGDLADRFRAAGVLD